jgi:hypothetical protein
MRVSLIVSVLVFATGIGNAQTREDSVQGRAVTAAAIEGRLATVEPAASRITIVPKDGSIMVELAVVDATTILLDEQSLTLSDLVLHVGTRVWIDYREDAGMMIADAIRIEGVER